MHVPLRQTPIGAAHGRIVLFVCDLSPTGVVRNTVALAERLQRDGHAVEIVACHLDGTDFWSIDPAIRLTALRPGKHSTDIIALTRVVLRLRRHLRRARPDVLLSMGNRGHLLCWAASRGLDRPARIYRVSNDLTHVGAASWSPRRWLSRMARRAGLRLLAADASQIAVVSPSLMAEPTLARAGNVVVAPNGVDVATVRRRMAEPADMPFPLGEEPIVLAIGRHVEQKNFATLTAAVGLANQRRPLRLVILGRGTEAEKAALRSVAAAHGIEDRLTLLDPVPNPFPYLRAARLFVLPSWWEGSSNALLEALACGTPVVASRTAGNAAAIIGDDRYGLLVDPYDTPSMAAAICRQIDGPSVAPGERALSYDLASTLDRYVVMVHQVLAKSVFERPGNRNPSTTSFRGRHLAGSSS